MVYLWIVNIFVAALSLGLWLGWQKRIAKYALGESKNGSSIYSRVIVPVMMGGVIVGLYLVPMAVSFIISYLAIRYLDVDLVSYSSWPFYGPHLLVLGFCLIQFYGSSKGESDALVDAQ